MVLALAIAACSQTESQNVRTGGLYPIFGAQGDEEGIDVSVYLRVGGPTGTLVDVDPPDSLTVAAGGEVVEMTEVDGLATYYLVNYDASDDGVELVFNLDRPEDTSAPSTVADLPPAPVITAPLAGEARVGGEPITVTWAAADPTYEVKVSASAICLPEGLSMQATGDPGTATFSDYPYAPDGQPCAVTLTVQRTGDGVLDPAFTGGGDIDTWQVRTVEFTLE